MSEKGDRSTPNAVRVRCEHGFVDALNTVRPDVAFNKAGYVLDPQHNLLFGIDLDEFRPSFETGAGQELGIFRDGVAIPGKFCAAYSSSALAVNHFAPFRRRELPALGRHRSLRLEGFEVKFPTGLRGTPPHLDVLVFSTETRVAIESKCLEYIRAKSITALEKTAARLRDKYLTGITGDRRNSPWFAELKELADDPCRYRYLDAAQLIKHALGLLHDPGDRPTVLLYLYWEPLDAGHELIFADHRNEIASFASRVADKCLRFEAMSYPELWDQWRDCGNRFLDEHVNALRQRYAFAASTV